MRGGAGGSGLQGPLEGEEAAFRLGGGSPGSLVMPVAMVGGGDSPRDCSQREGLNRVFHWMVGSLKVGMGSSVFISISLTGEGWAHVRSWAWFSVIES